MRISVPNGFSPSSTFLFAYKLHPNEIQEPRSFKSVYVAAYRADPDINWTVEPVVDVKSNPNVLFVSIILKTRSSTLKMLKIVCYSTSDTSERNHNWILNSVPKLIFVNSMQLPVPPSKNIPRPYIGIGAMAQAVAVTSPSERLTICRGK